MTLVSRIIRDLILVVVGILAFIDTPPSVQEAGIYGPLSKVWALMIGLGALVSFIGVVRRRTKWEIAGCTFVGGGFAVWTFAAMALPHISMTTVTVALVFLALTAGQFFRVGVLSERSRKLPG